MDQTVAKISSPALKVFDEELKAALAPIARFAGLEALPLVVKSPELKRSTASVDIAFLFTNEFHTQQFAGHPTNADHLPILNNPKTLVKEKADARFREAIGADALRGLLRQGAVGGGSQLVCDEAYALSQHNCGCDNGVVDCRGCNRTGRMVCNHCQFSFSAGSGRETCTTCYGNKGNRDAAGKWWNCSTCGGHGTVWCRVCGGSQQLTCTGCGGHGECTCRTCAGNGFFTNAHFFRMNVTPVIAGVATKVPAHVIECIKDWVTSGLQAHAKERTNPVLPWSDFQTVMPSYSGWKDGIYTATLQLTCEVTHADLQAEYAGSPSSVSYVRTHEPKFGFPNFLDYELVRIAAKTEKLKKNRPAVFLREVASVQGLKDGLTDFVSTNSWRQYWVAQTAAKMKGAISEKYLDRIAADYQRCLISFERKSVAGSLLTMTPVVSAFAAILWFFGAFAWLDDVHPDTRKFLFFFSGVFFAVLMNYAVRTSARKKVEKETKGISLLTLAIPGRLSCLGIGLAITYCGLIAARLYQ